MIIKNKNEILIEIKTTLLVVMRLIFIPITISMNVRQEKMRLLWQVAIKKSPGITSRTFQ
jgi:hypothetical protein